MRKNGGVRRFIEADLLIGDTLMQTPALRQVKLQSPGVETIYVTRPDGLAATILRGNPSIDRFVSKESAHELRQPGDQWVELSAWDALQYGIAHRASLLDGFAFQLGVTLDSHRLDLVLTPQERAAGSALRESFGPADGVIVCGRHSTTCGGNLGRHTNKCFSNEIWCDVAEWLIGKGYVPLAVGAASERDDPRFADWPGPKAYGYPLRTIAALIADARATFCVDTGLRFIAAATGSDLACLSGEIPTWLVFAPPIRQDQKIVERHCPLPMIGLNRCKEVLGKALNEELSQGRGRRG